MTNLKGSICFLFTLLVLSSCSQTKKIASYKRALSGKYLSYGPDTCYSRAILVHNQELVTANSNGIIYAYNIQKQTIRQLNKIASPELRDFVFTESEKILATQAADTGFLISVNSDQENKISLTSYPVFWDAIEMNASGFGLILGDPVNGRFQVFTSKNNGLNWTENKKGLNAIEGEAAFAASGSTAQVLNDSTYIFVSGGLQSRLFKTTDYGNSWKSFIIPFASNASSGPFSVHFKNENFGICVGGNYASASDTIKNCFYTCDGGLSWKAPQTAPNGYRSHVIEAKNIWYACGTSGIDFSVDSGKNWIKLNEINACAMTFYKGIIYATTKKGKIYFFNSFK